MVGALLAKRLLTTVVTVAVATMNQLTQVTEQLNDALREIEQVLHQKFPGCVAQIPLYGPETAYLIFDGQHLLLEHVHSNGVQLSSITSASRDRRVDAAHHVSSLVQVLIGKGWLQ